MQTCWAWTSLFCALFSLLLSIASIVENKADAWDNIDTIIDAVELCTMSTLTSLSLLQIWAEMDHHLFNIPLEQEEQPLQFTRKKNLRLADLSDPQARKMTHSYHIQLVHLYKLFNLEGYL